MGGSSARPPRRRPQQPSCAWEARSTSPRWTRPFVVPALVLHSPRDPIVAFEQGRWLAGHTSRRAVRGRARGARTPHFDCADQVIAEIRDFLTGSREPAEPEPALATVLFTDIVDLDRPARSATAGARPRASSPADRRRPSRSRYRGNEIDTAGDGFFASFDGPARALPLRARSRGDASPTRAHGRRLYTGECEVVDDKLAESGVHIGATLPSPGGPAARFSSRRRCEISSPARESSSTIAASTF